MVRSPQTSSRWKRRMSATCARNSDSHASAASRVPGSSRAPSVIDSTLPGFMHTYRSSLNHAATWGVPRARYRKCRAPGTEMFRYLAATTPDDHSAIRHLAQRGGTPMAVTRPPAPPPAPSRDAHRRRRARRHDRRRRRRRRDPRRPGGDHPEGPGDRGRQGHRLRARPRPALGVGLQVHRRQRVQPRRRRERDEVGRHRAVAELVQLRRRRPGGQLRRQHAARSSTATRSSGTRRCRAGPTTCPGPPSSRR